MKQIIGIILLSNFLFISLDSVGQGWQRRIGGTDFENAYSVEPTSDGGFILIGATTASGGDIYLIKTDGYGIVEWQKFYGTSGQDCGYSVLQSREGGYVFTGSMQAGTELELFIMKTDSVGNTIWDRRYKGQNEGNSGYSIKPTFDGGFIIGGVSNGWASSTMSMYLIKTDSLGIAEWEKEIYVNSVNECNSVIQTRDSCFVLGGSTEDTITGKLKLCLVKTDVNGDTLWTKSFGGAGLRRGWEVIETYDGGLAITGVAAQFGPGIASLYLLKTNAYGNMLWEKAIGTNYQDDGFALQETFDNGFIIAGNSYNLLYLVRTNEFGDTLWTKRIDDGGILVDVQGHSVKQLKNGEFIVAGWVTFNGEGDVFLLKTDSLGQSFFNFVEGTVFEDLNKDCLYDSSEAGSAIPVIIEAKGVQDWYGVSSDTGTYRFGVDTGSYRIRAIPPNSYWGTCSNLDSIEVTSMFVNHESFALLKPIVELCPFLEVDISTPRLRRCMSSYYYVHYSNTGTYRAQNAYIEVELDPYLNYLHSSIPLVSQIGNLYRFNVGDIEIGEVGVFSIRVNVSCSSSLGQIHCTSAHMYPDSLCDIDIPNIVIEDSCLVDTIQFTITNFAATNPNAVLYWILEDSVVVDTGYLWLYYGDSVVILHALQNANSFCQIILSPNEERYYNISSVENCDSLQNGNNLNGIFPLSNTPPFFKTDCRANVGSFDPNDKSAQPVGYGLEHYVFPNSSFDYLVRFQNTGTDTAFNIVIMDTLPLSLDLSTLKMGTSSHSYEWNLIGANVLEITFSNIMLPDSNVNESTSHGFVKFKISQNPYLPNQTIIENKAAIYFDFNDPVITNTVFHTVSDDFLPINLVGDTTFIEPIEINVSNLKIFPNPTNNILMLERESGYYNDILLQLFSINGQLLESYQMTGDYYSIELKNYPQGSYILRAIFDNASYNFKIIKGS